MNDETIGKLRSLLQSYGERAAKSQASPSKANQSERRAGGERLKAVVRPVLDGFMAELKNAGHEASTREHTERDDAYPSVALSFTPRGALASALIFKYDPRHGIVVQRDVKASPAKMRTATGSGDRLGTIGVDAITAAWVETKTLAFIEAVLRAN